MIEKLRRDHLLDSFNCGQPDLNAWLPKHALQNEEASAAQTYVGLVDGAVVGYYSLVVGQVEYAEAPERLQKGLARHPVPIMLLARLAAHKDWQGKGIGKSLLRDAVLRTVQAADIAGIRALAVHAKDDQARRYYEQFDFTASPTDPLHLFVLLKDFTPHRRRAAKTEGREEMNAVEIEAAVSDLAAEPFDAAEPRSSSWQRSTRRKPRSSGYVRATPTRAAWRAAYYCRQTSTSLCARRRDTHHAGAP